MERMIIKLSMFHTLALGVLSIWFGDWLRAKFPFLKKYCLPGAVVGGTIFAIISLLLYNAGICELQFDYKVANSLFYCIFFAASGAAASLSLLKTGGKYVIMFCISAAVLAALQNGIALGLGSVLKVPPLLSMMTGSIPMTGGHGNAAAFAPIAVQFGQSNAMEAAIAAATFGLISGAIIGGPFGRFIVRRHHLEDPALDGKGEMEEESGKSTMGNLMHKGDVVQAMYLMCFALGVGGAVFTVLKALHISFPIHVCCMFAGILIRLFFDARKGADHTALYEGIDTVGDFSLGLFVSMSIISMKLWTLAGMGLQLFILCMAQAIFIIFYSYFVDFFTMGKNYDAAVIAVGHTGFGLGAVPVSMVTMTAVCKKYRYSKLAFFVVPVIGGFLSNITNAIIISKFLDIAHTMQMAMGL